MYCSAYVYGLMLQQSLCKTSHHIRWAWATSIMVCGERQAVEAGCLPESALEGQHGRQQALVVVDPLSSGAVLAQMCMDKGYSVVRVLSTDFSEEVLNLVPAACKSLQFAASIQHKGDVDATLAALRKLEEEEGLDIVGVTVGCESGVELSDALSARLGKKGLLTNGEELSHARRDKYLMGERIREAGLRAARQVEASAWSEVEAFALELYGGPEGVAARLKLVLKPCRSAGTDNVFFVSSLAEARKAFDTILGDANIFGEANTTVLVQEFLQGTEYVVDCVSRDGVHKCVDVFVYDKRPCNGSKFVYYGVNLYESADGSREQRMSEYIFKVLDALGIRNGPSHAEVMWLDHENQPCLVEVGARPHGGEGTFAELSTPGIGYNQLEATIWALVAPERHRALPSRPGRLMAHAREVTLVAREEGVLKGYPLLEAVRALPSFKSLEIKVQPGQRLTKTTDFLTTPGSVMLVHESAEQVQADYDQIHEWSARSGLFYELEGEAPSGPTGSGV